MTFIKTLIGKVETKNFLSMQHGDVVATCADIEDLKRDISFESKTPLAKGIAKWVQWYSVYTIRVFNVFNTESFHMVKECKVIVVDVDGTLTLGKEDGTSYASAPVSALMKARLVALKSEGYWIILFTSRNMRTHEGNIGAIMKHTAPTLINWLAEHNIPYDELHFGKPWCGHDGFYIDDRAIRPREFIEKTHDELLSLLERDRLTL